MRNNALSTFAFELSWLDEAYRSYKVGLFNVNDYSTCTYIIQEIMLPWAKAIVWIKYIIIHVHTMYICTYMYVHTCTCIYMYMCNTDCYIHVVISRCCSDRVRLGSRNESRRVVAKGIFPGAQVKRGVDWSWGNQDGEAQRQNHMYMYNITKWEISVRRQTFSDHFMLLSDQRNWLVCHYIWPITYICPLELTYMICIISCLNVRSMAEQDLLCSDEHNYLSPALHNTCNTHVVGKRL